MLLKKLGRTEVFLPAIGQGTTGTGPLATRDEARDRHRIRVLQQGIDLGMTLIDTAELYGGGHGEELTGRAIAGRRHQVFLASKFNPANNAPAAMESALLGSLKRLGTDYLDLYQMHWPYPSLPIEETLGGLARLVEKGVIRRIGLSNVCLAELERACQVAEIASVQLEYNLTDRSIEADVLPFCEQHGISVLAYGVLDRGRSYAANPIIGNLSRKYGKSPSQIMLSWAMARQPVIVLTMTTNPEHLSEAAATADFKMAAEDMRALEESTRCSVSYVAPGDIRVTADSRPAYESLEAAVANPRDLIPHPVELAANIRKFGIEKPVRVKRLTDPGAPKPYQLVGEHLRFWAWIIAYGWERRIPVYDVTPPAGAV